MLMDGAFDRIGSAGGAVGDSPRAYFVRRLAMAPAEGPRGAYLSRLMGRTFVLLRMLEAAGEGQPGSDPICWRHFHEMAIAGASRSLAWAEAGNCREPGEPEVVTRRIQSELRALIELQLRQAFPGEVAPQPACLGHASIAQLEPLLGDHFTEELLGGAMRHEVVQVVRASACIRSAALELLRVYCRAIRDYYLPSLPGSTGEAPSSAPERPGLEPAGCPPIYC